MDDKKKPSPAEEMEDIFRLLDKLEEIDRTTEANLSGVESPASGDKAVVEPEGPTMPQAQQSPRPVRIEEDATLQSEADLEPAGASASPQEPAVILGDDFDLIMPEDEWEEESYAEDNAEDEDEELPPVPARRNPFAVFWRWLRGNLPAKGDTPGTLVRKLAFCLALVVFLVSLGYILVDVFIIPMQNDILNTELEELYQPDNSAVITEGNYPEGMMEGFRQLYDRNPEVRGYLRFNATGKNDFLNIAYPVVYSGDNDKYLTLDFDQKKNKNGTLFFDMNNRLESAQDENRALIIYGHNMASGQMFAGLNKFIGSVGNARAAVDMTMNTLYENATYRVFAVLLTDEQETENWYFNTRRTQFAGEADFLNYVQQLRDRSLFDYPTEVVEGDELLVLSTCTSQSTAKIKDGRLVVVARKVRPGEGAINTAEIQRNNDVIMPRSWYVNQGLALHTYYGGDHWGLTTTQPTTRPTTRPTGSTVVGTETGTGVGTGTDSTTTGTGTKTTGAGTAGTGTAAETTAAGTTPAGTTAGTTTAAETPSETQPTETQPTETQPTETQPTESQPSETQPVETQPVETNPDESTDNGGEAAA